MEKFLREFQPKALSRSGFRGIIRQLMQEGSTDINYTHFMIYNAALRVMHSD